MKRWMIGIVVAGIVWSAGVSYAQQDGPPAMPQKVRNMLEKFVGTWSWQDEMLTGTSVCRWDPAGNYVICQDEAWPWGTSLFAGTLIAWDSVSEDGIVMYGVGPAMHNSNRMKIVSDTVMEGEGTGAFFGNPMAATLRWESQGPDRHTLVATHPTDGDEPPYISTTVNTLVKSTSDKQELLRLANVWLEAEMKNDAEAVARLWADDLTYSSSTGAVETKSQALASIKSGDLKISDSVYDHLDVRVYGDTGVTTGIVSQKGQYKGTDISGKYRFTDTWIKRDGRWQCVATHASKIAEDTNETAKSIEGA